MKILHSFRYPAFWAARHPGPTILALAVLVMLSVTSLFFLKFENDVVASFASGSDAYVEYQELMHGFGGKPIDIQVLVSSSKRFSPENFEALRELSLEFGLLENVGFVSSIYSLRFPKDHTVYGGELLFPESSSPLEFETRLEAYKEAGVSIDPLITSDLKLALVVISAQAGSGEGEYRTLIREIREVLAQFDSNVLKFGISGDEALGQDIASALKRDIWIFNIAGMVIALITTSILLMNLPHIILAIVPATCSLLISLALFPLFDVAISISNIIVPVLVLVLALADSVHLVIHLARSDTDETHRQNIDSTICSVVPACALAAITTIIALLAIAASENYQLQVLAGLGALAIAISFPVTVCSFAALSGIFPQVALKSSRKPLQLVGENFTAFMLKQGRRTILCSVLIGLSGCLITASLTPWFNLKEILPENSESREVYEKVEEQFGASFKLWSEVNLMSGEDTSSGQNWQKLGKVSEALNTHSLTSSIVSLSTIANQESLKLPRDLDQALDIVSPLFRDQLYSENEANAWVIGFAPQPMSSVESLSLFDTFEATARDSGADAVVGIPVILRQEPVAIIKQLAIGLTVAIVFTSVFIALVFRSLKLIPVIFAVNALPLMLTSASLLILINGHISPTAVMALTIAFGIATNDSIHLVNRYYRELQSEEDRIVALARTMKGSGNAVVITTIIATAGTLVTLLSAFSSIEVFGAIMAVALVTAMLSDLLLLPALVSKFGI